MQTQQQHQQKVQTEISFGRSSGVPPLNRNLEANEKHVIIKHRNDKHTITHRHTYNKKKHRTQFETPHIVALNIVAIQRTYTERDSRKTHVCIMLYRLQS